MGGAKEGIGPTMEVDSIVVEVAIENIQVAPDTIETTIKSMHLSTLSTIIDFEEGIENLQSKDANNFWQKQDSFIQSQRQNPKQKGR